MSRRRRVVCVTIGILMVLFALMMGWSSAFLTHRIGNPYSMDTASKLLIELQESGATFPMEKEARGLIYDVVWHEVQTRGAGMTFGYFVTGLNGLLLCIFGVWPSRQSK